MADEPRFAYGVWIHARGWLKKDGEGKVKERVFATPHIEIANSAKWLLGDGASVFPIDESLIDLEQTFVERDNQRDIDQVKFATQTVAVKRKWWQR